MSSLNEEILAWVDTQIADWIQHDFEALSAPERVILNRLSASRSLPASTSSTYLYGMSSLRLLRRVNGNYAIGNDFFPRWLRDHADWEGRTETSAESTLAVYLTFKNGNEILVIAI